MSRKALKNKGIAQFARQLECSEGAVRLMDKQGIVHPQRDPWGRRLFGDDDIQAAREHLASRRALQAVGE